MPPNHPDDQLRLARPAPKSNGCGCRPIRRRALKLVELSIQSTIKVDLSGGDQKAAGLKMKLDLLSKWLDDLDGVIRQANSDETRDLKAMVQQADLQEKQAEFDKAIELYEAVLKVRDDADLKTYLQRLKKAWTARSPEHIQAPAIHLCEMADVRPECSKGEFRRGGKRVCKRVKKEGDRMTPVKLQMVNIQHALALAKELKQLNRSPDSEDNRAKIKAMSELVERLHAPCTTTPLPGWRRTKAHRSKGTGRNYSAVWHALRYSEGRGCRTSRPSEYLRACHTG